MAAVPALPVSLSGRFKGSVTAWRARQWRRGGGREGAEGPFGAPPLGSGGFRVPGGAGGGS